MSTPSRAWTAALAAGLVLMAVSGCGLLSDDESPDPKPATSTPAPKGTGPYPEPSDPTVPEPVPTGSGGTPKGGIPTTTRTDMKDATAVSKAAVKVMWTSDTKIDKSAYDASLRLVRGGWCTGRYGDQLKEGRPRQGGGAQWAEWQKHRAYTTVKATLTEEAGKPQDTETKAYRQWTVIVTPHGRDVWKGAATQSLAFVELTRSTSGDPWRLSAVTVR